MNVPRRVRGPGGYQREQGSIRRIEGDSCRVNVGDGIDGGTYAHPPSRFGDGSFSVGDRTMERKDKYAYSSW